MIGYKVSANTSEDRAACNVSESFYKDQAASTLSKPCAFHYSSKYTTAGDVQVKLNRKKSRQQKENIVIV